MTPAEGMVLVLAVILAGTALAFDGTIQPAATAAMLLLGILAAVAAVLHIAGIAP